MDGSFSKRRNAFFAILKNLLWPVRNFAEATTDIGNVCVVRVAKALVQRRWKSSVETARSELYTLAEAILGDTPGKKAVYLGTSRRHLLKTLLFIPVASLDEERSAYFARAWQLFVDSVRCIVLEIENPGAIRAARWLATLRLEGRVADQELAPPTCIETYRFFDRFMTAADYAILKSEAIEDPYLFVMNSWVRRIMTRGYRQSPKPILYHDAPAAAKDAIRQSRRETATEFLRVISSNTLDPDVLLDLAIYTSLGDDPENPNRLVKAFHQALRHDPRCCDSAAESLILYYQTAERAAATLGSNLVRGIYSYSPLIAQSHAAILARLKSCPHALGAWQAEYDEAIYDAQRANSF